MSNYISRRLRAFGPAVKGIIHFFKTEENGWFHAGSFVVAFALCFGFDVSAGEWIVVIFAVVLVLSTELLNSAIEKLCDFVEPNYDKRIGIIKDMAAGAVLVAALFAVVVACIVFGPRIVALF
jgi:diacylglycerol kinase (ATP)